MHKVKLTRIDAKTDLKGLVHALASHLKSSPHQVVEMLRHLPITLAESASAEAAAELQKQFGAFRCLIEVNPLPPPPPTHLAKEIQPQVKAKHRWFSALLILAIVAVTGLGLWFGQDLVFEAVAKIKQKQSNSPESGNEEKQTTATSQATAWLYAARNDQDRKDWKGYGSHGEVPYEGQDLLPDARLDSALEVLLQEAKTNPHNPLTYYLLAEIYMEKGLAQDAISYAELGAKLAPQDPNYGNLLGQTYLAAGQEGHAEQVFRNVAKKHPDFLITYRNLGILLLYHQKDSTQALQWLHYYLATEPGKDWDRMDLRQECAAIAFHVFNPPLQELRPIPISFEEYESKRRRVAGAVSKGGDSDAEWTMAQITLARGMDDVAMSLMQRLFQRQELPAEGLIYLSALYAKQKAWDSVIRLLQFGAERYPNPFFHRNLGALQLYYKLNATEALAAWKQYLALGGDNFAEKVQAQMPKAR